jgi:hypothetical protein
MCVPHPHVGGCGCNTYIYLHVGKGAIEKNYKPMPGIGKFFSFSRENWGKIFLPIPYYIGMGRADQGLSTVNKRSQ